MPGKISGRLRRFCLLAFVLSASLLTPLSSATMTTEPVLKLTGDVVVADSVGGNHLTFYGAAGIAPAGKIGPAYDFDGVSGYATTANQVYSLSGGTVTLWFMARHTGRQVITVSYDGSNQPHAYVLH
ncbi:MAG: hypothetical protein ACR2HX_19125 [Pyrinomonadaceae bacterium]